MNYPIDKWIHAADGNGNGHKVIIKCPTCDLRLGLTHEISADGTVSPSVVCTHDGCDFHEFVKLANYPDEPGLFESKASDEA